MLKSLSPITLMAFASIPDLFLTVNIMMKVSSDFFSVSDFLFLVKTAKRVVLFSFSLMFEARISRP